MLQSIIKSLSCSKTKTQRELLRFAEIEYKKEDPAYILHLINSGKIFRN